MNISVKNKSYNIFRKTNVTVDAKKENYLFFFIIIICNVITTGKLLVRDSCTRNASGTLFTHNTFMSSLNSPASVIMFHSLLPC